VITWQLERVRRGEVRRLIINMRPRSLKSIAASVAFPAFVLGHDPSRRIICVSYSGDLAKKHANDFRAVLESPWYRSAFPSTRIGPFKNSETEIKLTACGFRLATSVGGTLTGPKRRGRPCKQWRKLFVEPMLAIMAKYPQQQRARLPSIYGKSVPRESLR
jgi:hypothetical protein